jgi:hypothetical protein
MLKVLLCFLIFTPCLFAQNSFQQDYREDQVILGISYPFFTNAAPEITQNRFSHSLQAGFVRDMPINQRRNLACGLGLGVSYNVVYNNLRLTDDSQSFAFISNPDTNQWTWTELTLPLEFRWRTSAADVYKFWRIYGGITAIYTLHAQQNYQQSGFKPRFSSLPFEQFRFAFHLSVGNNTWNIYYLHSINSLLESSQTAENVTLNDLGYAKIGLNFYLF